MTSIYISPHAENYLRVFDAWCQAGFEDAPEFITALKDRCLRELVGDTLADTVRHRAPPNAAPHRGAGTPGLMLGLVAAIERTAA